MNKITVDSFLNLILKLIGICINYIYISVLLNYLGESEYGIWIIIVTITSWLSFFDVGLGNGLRNKLTEAIERKDNQTVLVSSTYHIVIKLMSLVCVFGVILAYFINWKIIFKTDFDETNIKYAIIISVVFMAVNIVFSLCKSICFALQKSSLASSSGVLAQIINFISFLIIRKYTHVSILMLALIYGISEFIIYLGMTLYIIIHHPNLKPQKKYANKECEKELLVIGSRFLILQLCALVLYSTDSFIISCLYSAKSVTPYSMVIKIYTLVINLFAAFVVPLWSAVTKEKMNKRWDIVEKYEKIIVFLMIPIIIIVFLLILNFRTVSFIWLKKELVYSDLLIFLGGIYCVLSIWCNSFATLANGLGILNKPMIVAIIQAVLNIPLSLLFAYVFDMKESGVLLGTISVMIIGSIIVPYEVYSSIKKHNL